MDGMRPPEVNPLSSAFHQKAALNVQQNLASMKSQKELRQEGEAADEPERPADQVVWTASQNQLPASPGQTGRGVESSRRSAATELSSQEGGAKLSEGDATEWAAQKARAAGLMEERDPALVHRKRVEARRKAEEGVPAEILQASRQIVEGQVDGVKGPSASLQGLKNVPEAAQMRIEAEDFHPALDIHDTGNQPLVDEGEAPKDGS